jgi:hypothetical protein
MEFKYVLVLLETTKTFNFHMWQIEVCDPYNYSPNSIFDQFWSSKIDQICLTPLFHYVKIDPHFCHWICPMCAGIPYMHLCHACPSGRTPCHRGEPQSLCQINALVAGHYPTQRSPFLTWTIRPQDLHHHFWAIWVACFRHGEHRNAYGDPIVCIIEGNRIKIFNAVNFTHTHLEHIIDLINLLKIGR